MKLISLQGLDSFNKLNSFQCLKFVKFHKKKTSDNSFYMLSIELFIPRHLRRNIFLSSNDSDESYLSKNGLCTGLNKMRKQSIESHLTSELT